MKLIISKDDSCIGYLQLKNHPGRGVFAAVDKHVRISELLSDYIGPEIVFDFAADGQLIGLEIDEDV